MKPIGCLIKITTKTTYISPSQIINKKDNNIWFRLLFFNLLAANTCTPFAKHQSNKEHYIPNMFHITFLLIYIESNKLHSRYEPFRFPILGLPQLQQNWLNRDDMPLGHAVGFSLLQPWLYL